MTRICRRERGLALAITLIVLTVVVVLGFGLTTLGIQNLTFANVEKWSKTALFVAEGGANYGIRQLRANNALADGTLADYTMGVAPGSFATVHVTNNLNGSGTNKSAPNGQVVVPGMAYVLATGLTQDGRYRRQVGVMVRRAPGGAFNYAIATGNNMDIKASADIYGPIKSSRDIILTANTDVFPKDGKGDVLASAKVDNGSNNLNMMGSGQEVRARGTGSSATTTSTGQVTNQAKVKDAALIADPDTSEKTLPFIGDGRYTTTLSSGEAGEVLPNPNPKNLFAGNVTHTETVISGDFDLGAGNTVHYFPNGIKFTNTANFIGQGTILVGDSKTAEFDCNVRPKTGSSLLKMNIIAIGAKDAGDGQTAPFKTTVGSNSIIFNGNVLLEGLVYSHDDVKFQAAATVKGSVIAYKSGGGDTSMSGGGSKNFELAPLAVPVPGFEAFFGGGNAPMLVVSWQRM